MRHNKLLLIGLFLLMGLPINAMDDGDIMNDDDMRQAIQDDDVDWTRHLLDMRLQTEPDFRVGVLLQWAETVQMATVLIDEYGADVNERFNAEYQTNLTPLDTVKTKQVAELLLDRGADLHDRTKGRDTPLHRATLADNIPVMEALLARGTNPNLQGIEGNTALMYATTLSALNNSSEKHSNRIRKVRLLLSHGADPSIANYGGNRPITSAKEYGFDELTHLFKPFERQQKLLFLLRANKAPNIIILLRNRELYGTFHSPH